MEPKDFDSNSFKELTFEAEQSLLVNFRTFAFSRSLNTLPPISDFYKAIQHLCTSVLWAQDEIFKNSKGEKK